MGQEEVIVDKTKCKNTIQTKTIINIQLYKTLKTKLLWNKKTEWGS
jgi:hypothetical protein